MRHWLALACIAISANGAVAARSPTANRIDVQGKGSFMGDGDTEPRTGGDTIGSAALIPGLPYDDTGATCGYANDYDEVCPYTDSSSPDVVYQNFSPINDALTVDLCASDYDTKVYIYAGGPGNLIACNDDAGCGYSGLQSLLQDVPPSAVVNYYIVIDGYGGACGG